MKLSCYSRNKVIYTRKNRIAMIWKAGLRVNIWTQVHHHLFFFFPVYLKDRYPETHQRIFHLLVHFLNSQVWSRLEPGVTNSILVFHMDIRAQALGCHPGCINRKLDWKQNRWDLNWCSDNKCWCFKWQLIPLWPNTNTVHLFLMTSYWVYFKHSERKLSFLRWPESSVLEKLPTDLFWALWSTPFVFIM